MSLALEPTQPVPLTEGGDGVIRVTGTRVTLDTVVHARSRRSLRAADDPAVLSWAAQQDRVLVSHDLSTLTGFAYARVEAGQRMPGLTEAGPEVPNRYGALNCRVWRAWGI